MLPRDLSGPDLHASWWSDLERGAPTILGLARLAALALESASDPWSPQRAESELSPEARTLLVLAAERGTFEIRASRESFEAAERRLGVCVETEPDRWQWLLDKSQPEQTMKFLEGFRQLAAGGLVLHQLQTEFSLTAAGFKLARNLDDQPLAELLAFGSPVDH